MDILGGISVGKDLFQFFDFIRGVVGADTISAYFRYDGTRVHGSERIEIELIRGKEDHVFWLAVKGIDDYAFIRFPINDSGCEEIIGTIENQVLANPSYWRWVQAARSGTIVGGQHEPPNAMVDFVVVGYRPKAVIDYLSSGA